MRQQGRRSNVPSVSRIVKPTKGSNRTRDRLTCASKADAEAVIVDAQSRLASVDISSFGGELTTVIGAAIRHITSKAFKAVSASARPRADVQRLANLLDRIHRSIPAERCDEVERECRALDIDPTIDAGLLTSVLVAVSDVLRASIAPRGTTTFIADSAS